MFASCIEKQKQIVSLFSACSSQEEKYKKIIELGKAIPPLDPSLKLTNNIVSGCQSTTYLHSFLKDGRIFFATASDALISAGLAALLIQVYNDELPETVLKCPPDYLKVMEIYASLTPNRANGLYNIHLRMQQDALKFLVPRVV
jgi:cysteine desulfuration protein SufE